MTRRGLFWAGNALGAACLLLIFVDPVGNRYVIFALAGACVVFTYILPWLLRPKGK
jgi:hypothetical protein